MVAKYEEEVMLYALLIYQAEETINAMAPEEIEELLVQHRALHARTKEDETFRGADRLMNTSVATTIRTRGGKTEVTDGPYAETKEQLAGLYIVECANLDDAIDRAKMIPQAEHGGVEVRPIAYHEDLTGSADAARRGD